MPYIEESLEKFKSLPPEIILSVDCDRVASEMYKLNEKYKVNLSALIIFIVTGDLMPEQVLDYIQTEFNLSKRTAKKIFDDLEDEIFIPLTERLKFLDPNQKIDVKKGQSIVSEIFEKGLVDELRNNEVVTKVVNARIFSVLSDNYKFKNVLEKILYSNSELITHGNFILDGTFQSPTIGSWIQDFIKRNGSENFNSLVLTDYLANSENAKILSLEEKHLIQKLLLLYRNLKFFPESMPSDNPDDWEIIPTDKGIDNLTKARSVSGPPKTSEEKDIDVIKMEEEKYPVGGLERMVLEEEVNRKKKIEELKIIADKYRDGSLEKSAVMEEIKKLEK